MKLWIKGKILIGMACILAITYGLSILLVGHAIQKSNGAIIEKDINKHVYNLRLYIKQFIWSSEIEETEESFKANANEIGTILSTKLDERVLLYSEEGSILYDSINQGGVIHDSHSEEDLEAALRSRIAYTINNRQGKGIIVTVSVPVIVEDQGDKRIGIIRYVYNYDYLQQSSKELFFSINIAVLIIFSSLFCFVYFFASRITKPIVHLSKASHKIARGEFQHHIEVDTGDELERLAENFIMMKNNIQQRIQEVEIERDNLKRMQKHRKLFFDNVTHELKTPLTIISGYTQILQTYDEEDKAFTMATLEKINKEAEHLHSMVLDLLDTAKMESDLEYEFRVINMFQVIHEAVEGMLVKEPNAKINVHSSHSDYPAYGDRRRWIQAFNNLMDNSIKFSEGIPIIDIYLEDHGKKMTVAFVDQGMGINDQDLKQIFYPFHRHESNKRDSSGLGLYIVQSICQHHGGEIQVESEVNKGSTFIIRLPKIMI